MARIERGVGGTASERLLARIAEESFLNLWTFPSPYKDQKLNGKGDGKELCDLLVVCGDDVIVFSDKAIGWSEDKERDVAWARWFRAAVVKSAHQVAGAESWLRKFPERVFLDKACTQPLPVELPPIERRRVHGVVVALGAEEATRAATGHPQGMHLVAGDVRGAAHWDRSNAGFLPFAVGDIEPEKSFVHVFSQAAIELVLRMLDTIEDFARYLERRADAIRNQRIVHAFGEADLVAYYLRNADSRGEHSFLWPDGRPLDPGDRLFLEPGQYEALVREPAYLRKVDADRVSYVWDRIISKFAEHVLQGTSIGAEDGPVHSREADVSLRLMARENRVSRRGFGQAIMEAYDIMTRRAVDRFARILLPMDGSAMADVGYVFVILAMPEWIDPVSGYEEYRALRKTMAGIYALSVLAEHPELKECVAIAVDAPPPHRRAVGGSEDLVYVHRGALTPERRAELVRQRKTFGIMTAYRKGAGARMQRVDEYPDAVAPKPPGGNRRERRARNAAKRRRSG